MQEIPNRHIPMFQLKSIVDDNVLEEIRNDIKRQFEDGTLIVIDEKLRFLGYILQPV